MTDSSGTITRLLLDWRAGDKAAFDQLFPLVYQELRRLAASYLRRQRANQTLQTTALINEAYLRLIDYKNMGWQNRAHFYAMAAQAIRRILADHARSQGTAKRGGRVQQVELEAIATLTVERALELVALDDALLDLERFDSRKCRVVELRYFGGLSVEETAEVLGISAVTVMRDWNGAKGWLLRELSKQQK